MKPLVAVTAITRSIEVNLPTPLASATVDRRFGELIAAAGGLPVLAAPDADPEELADRVDAVIVNGGQDVDPSRYGAEPDPNLRAVDPERDEFELALVDAARRRELAAIGVCRGHHIVNVAAGGTLIQHLPDRTELDHECRRDFNRPCHSLEIDGDSALGRALVEAGIGTRVAGSAVGTSGGDAGEAGAASGGSISIEVNSVHHQAVERVGDGLIAVAHAPDGVIEAIEGDAGRTLGIQWHPEFLDSVHDPTFLAILRRFLGTTQ